MIFYKPEVTVTLENLHEVFEPYLYNEEFVRKAAKLRFTDFKGHERICADTLCNIAIATENIRRDAMFFNVTPVGYTMRMKKLLKEYGLMIPEDDFYGNTHWFEYDKELIDVTVFPEREPDKETAPITDVRKYVSQCITCGAGRIEYEKNCPYCGSVYFIFMKEPGKNKQVAPDITYADQESKPAGRDISSLCRTESVPVPSGIIPSGIIPG